MWYGSEVLQHRDSIDGEMMVDSCVTIHLKETTHEVRSYLLRTPSLLITNFRINSIANNNSFSDGFI